MNGTRKISDGTVKDRISKYVSIQDVIVFTTVVFTIIFIKTLEFTA